MKSKELVTLNGDHLDIRFCPNSECFGPCDELTLPEGPLVMTAEVYFSLSAYFLRRGVKLQRYLANR